MSLFLPASLFAEEGSPRYQHAITFVHPHTASTLTSAKKPTEPQLFQATDIQLPQTTDFGTFRLQYAYQNLWGNFAPWAALGGNLHKGFLEYPVTGSSAKTEVSAKIGFGVLAGMQYRFDIARILYVTPSLGYGHYFSSQIDVDLVGTNATQSNGCHEICVTGSVDSILYSVVIGLRITPYLAFELGLEHDLFFSNRQQTLTDGNATTASTGGVQFSDALMFSFGLTFQFNL